MKRIHFDNGRNWFWIAILILSLIFIGTGIFELLNFENLKISKSISAIGFLLQVIYFSRMFWYKNYVHWNKKGMVIRINALITKSLRFDQIKTYEMIDNTLSIYTNKNRKVTFDLSNIKELDVLKLNKILIQNT